MVVVVIQFHVNCRLVGDNIDIMVQIRIQTKQHENRSIHWTQQYGILNRVNEPSLNRSRPQQSLQEIQMIDLLPGKDVQHNLKTRWAALVARVVCKYLGKFTHLNRALIYHIQHKYSKEMTNKSETVINLKYTFLLSRIFYAMFNC